MKLVHITFQFQYADAIEAILAERGVRDFLRHPRAAGHDSDGRHDGSQAFPGQLSSVQALVADDGVGDLLEALRRFRDEKRAHGHVRAVVLPVDQAL